MDGQYLRKNSMVPRSTGYFRKNCFLSAWGFSTIIFLIVLCLCLVRHFLALLYFWHADSTCFREFTRIWEPGDVLSVSWPAPQPESKWAACKISLTANCQLLFKTLCQDTAGTSMITLGITIVMLVSHECHYKQLLVDTISKVVDHRPESFF